MESFLSHLQSLDDATCPPPIPSSGACVTPLGNLFCSLSPQYGAVSSFAFPPELPPPGQMQMPVPMPAMQPFSVQFAAAAAAASAQMAFSGGQSYGLHSQMPYPPPPPQHMLQYGSPQGAVRATYQNSIPFQSPAGSGPGPQTQSSLYFNPLYIQPREPPMSNNNNNNENHALCGGPDTQDAGTFTLNSAPQTNGAPASPTHLLSLSLPNEFAVGGPSSGSGELSCTRGHASASASASAEAGAGAQQPLVAITSTSASGGPLSAGGQQAYGGSVSACTDATSDVLGLVGTIYPNIDH